jgi:predicted NAD/FAD-binding protein
MAFDERGRRALGKPGRIAVVGSGVAGLGAAWLLSRTCEVVLYEADGRLGGHANTVDAPLDAGGAVAVDAGFIVYNAPAYPNLVALFDHLGIESEETCMSFGASLRGGAVEYSGQSLSSVFADRARAFSPSYLRMLVDVSKFHKDARRALARGFPAGQTLGAFVAANRYGRAFARDFLKPMASAIWSTPSARIFDYSAEAFIRFYDNHGLLQVLNLPTWRTVRGGSRRYVEAISRDFAGRARLRTPVSRLVRGPAGVEIVDAGGGRDRFDAVVVAAHADDALRMLDAPSAEERRVLGAFKYQPNRAVVHFDESQMPKRRRVWSSWNYIGDEERAAVVYWMNRLQNLDCAENIFVTLNPIRPVAPDRIVAEFDYSHPMFDVEVAAAQRDIWRIQGAGGVWHAGAHFGQGFHEDGLQAGLAVAEAIGGLRRPWRVENESGRIFLPAPQAEAA